MAAAESATATPRRGCVTYLLDQEVPLPRRAAVAFVIYVVVLAVGGAIFSWLEMTNEIRAADEYEQNLATVRRQLVISLANDTVSLETVLAAVNRLQAYAEAAGAAPSSAHLNWDFGGATFYTMTVASTIGFGSYTPQTDAGKALTVIYGSFGIFCTGVIVSVLAEVWSKCIDGISLRRAARVAGATEGEAALPSASTVRANRIWSAVALGAVMLLVGSAVFHATDGWAYGDAVYATWVMASTCGFGDFTPGNRGVFSYIFIILCLALFAAVIQSFQTIAEERAAERGPEAHKIEMADTASKGEEAGGKDCVVVPGNA